MNIYISGSIGYDEIMDFPGHFKDYFHPEKLHQINVSFAVARLSKHVGGIATNIAYAISQLNSKINIYPVGAVGKDGGDVIAFFKKNKIAVDYIQTIDDLYTTTGKVITDMNDNQIWGYYYGASAKLNPTFLTQTSQTKSLWVLSATHEKPFSAILRYCIANKIPYLFDPGMTLTWIRDDMLKKGVLNAAYLVGNDYEMAMIEKRLTIKIEDVVRKGVNVITTLGEKGVRALIPSARNAHATITVSPFKVRKVVDPTGAGDAWRGGFVSGIAEGLPVEECLKLGNVMGSMAVEQVGTVTYTATKEEIKKRMEKIKVKKT
jgi:adenosine kinase